MDPHNFTEGILEWMKIRKFEFNVSGEVKVFYRFFGQHEFDMCMECLSSTVDGQNNIKLILYFCSFPKCFWLQKVHNNLENITQWFECRIKIIKWKFKFLHSIFSFLFIDNNSIDLKVVGTSSFFDFSRPKQHENIYHFLLWSSLICTESRYDGPT